MISGKLRLETEGEVPAHRKGLNTTISFFSGQQISLTFCRQDPV